jgi:hypothetical protein
VRQILVKRVLTRFSVAKKSAQTGEAVYRSPRIYLPTKLTDDSVFPFKEGDLLLVRVDGRRLVVQRVRKPPEQVDSSIHRGRSSVGSRPKLVASC